MGSFFFLSLIIFGIVVFSEISFSLGLLLVEKQILPIIA